MTRSVRPGQIGAFRALGAVLGAAAVLGLVSAAACLGDLPAFDGDGGTGGQDGGGTTRGDARTAAPTCGDGIIQRLPDGGGEVCDPGPDAGTPSTAASCSPDCTSIVCPTGGFVWPMNDHCYFALGDGNVSMSKAAAACADQGAHVVTFDDLDEQNAVDGFFCDAGFYWIALTQDAAQTDPIYDVGGINEPGWRVTCPGCYGPAYGKNAPSFLNVCKLFVTAGACVAHDVSVFNGSFIGANCSGTCDADASTGTGTGTGGAADAGGFLVHGVCEREPAGLTGVPCDDGGVCITIRATSSTYELEMPVSAALPWADAQMACTQKTGANGAHGHLVVFQTAEERAQLSRELSARLQEGAPELSYWVGLQNVVTDAGSSWTWVDGVLESVYPSEWADGEPSPSTGPFASATVEVVAESTTFDRQLLHAATNGDVPLPYVCEFGP